MTSERFQMLQQNGGVIDLSDRAKFRLSGGDRVRYLNGQVTNDVRKAKADESVYACVTNLKGRIEGDVFIHTGSDGESLFLDAEPGLREALAMRLERYIIADDVELADVTDEWRLFHFFGATAEIERLSAIKTKGRLGGRGLDVWFRASVPTPAFDCDVVTADEAETLRICNGIPKWPLELNSEAFPAEAGLQNLAMDYAKGCYIGQEILSRIKTTGKMPRVLVRWLGGPEKPESTALFVRNEEGNEKEIGVITSSCLHPVLDRWVGLAYVRQGTEVMDSVLLADKVTPRMFSELEIIHP
jgi:tRNA-modifying protein YgfZ